MRQPYFFENMELDIPDTMADELKHLTLDDIVNGVVSYEVVGKNSTGIKLRITGINLKNNKKRI